MSTTLNRVARIAIAVSCLASLTFHPAISAPNEAEMCAVIQADILAYLATGRPCACPYSLLPGGSIQCGNLSAWAKPSGKAPRCYFQDVTGEFPPNRRPSRTRETWPPTPCRPLS